MDEDNPGSVGYFYDRAKVLETYPVYFITPLDLDDVVNELQRDEQLNDWMK